MVNKIKSLALLLLAFNLNQCQMNKEVPEFQVEISQPENKFSVRPVSDEIRTLEGIYAGLPYGGSSGKWGDSGKGWTEQHGTPSGADIVYFSEYEEKFYHLNVDFDKEKIKEFMKRAYARIDDKKDETKEYKELGRSYVSGRNQPYDSFSTLVFGFAPKGMVVVWLRFGIGNTQIELDRFQAIEVTDHQLISKSKKKYLDDFRITEDQFKEANKKYLIPNASPELWDNYRKRYQWAPIATSQNKNFELLQIITHYYNGERENMLRPWVKNPPVRQRGIPSQLQVFWQTGKESDQRKVAEIYLDWNEVEKVFNSSHNKNIKAEISEDNSSIQLTIDGNPLKADSIRIFPWPSRWEQNYKGID